MMKSISDLLGVLFILLSMFVFVSSVIGIYRFKYVLNRMHSAALCETLGMMLLVTGLTLLLGASWHAAKMILIVIFLWLASPVASHLIARAEVLTHAHIEDELEVVDDDRRS
jgi:multicomponent Na+:H+ antiporter subunit G